MKLFETTNTHCFSNALSKPMCLPMTHALPTRKYRQARIHVRRMHELAAGKRMGGHGFNRDRLRVKLMSKRWRNRYHTQSFHSPFYIGTAWLTCIGSLVLWFFPSPWSWSCNGVLSPAESWERGVTGFSMLGISHDPASALEAHRHSLRRS